MEVKEREALADLRQTFRDTPDKKIEVAVDHDGTLADFHKVLVANLNRRNGTSYAVKDITDWDMSKTKFKLSIPELMKLHNEIWTQQYDQVEPTVSVALMRKFTSTFPVTVATHRREEQMPYVAKWLEKNYPGISFGLLNRKPEEKLDGQFKILFDDGPPEAKAAKELTELNGRVNTTLFFIQKPWNQRGAGYENTKGIVLIPDLATGMEMVLRMHREVRVKQATNRPRPSGMSDFATPA